MNWKKIIASLTLFAFVASCKPVGGDDTTLMAAGKKTAILDLVKASCDLACAKIENKAVLAFTGGEEPAAETEVKFGDAKLLWSFSKYLMKRKARSGVKVTEKKDAGTKAPTPPADSGAKTTTGAGFFTKHFALSSGGLVMSTSNNIREKLKTGGTKIDAAQVTDAKAEQAKKKDFYAKPDSTKGPKLTAAQKAAAKKQEAAALRAQTEAIKLGSKLWKKQGGSNKASFSFAAALDKFKKTEKIRISTDVEVKTVQAKLTAEAWIGAKVLNVGVGGAKFLQLVASAGLDAPTVTNAKASASLRLLFFGVDVPGTTKEIGKTLIDKIFPVPAIPSANIPIYGFPSGGITAEIQFLPATGLGIDVDVKKAGMFTISFIPAISLVMNVTVGAQAAVLTLGVEGTTTILALEVPLSVSMGGDIKGGLYYTGINYVGVKVTALGGTGISLVAKVDVPSPFNYVLWGVLSAATIAGLKLPGELGFGETAYKYAYPLWEPEFKLEIAKSTKRAGPRMVKLPAKPTAAQCTKLKTNIAEHVKLAKAEVDTKKDVTLTAIENGQNDMLNQLQKAITAKCGGGTTKTSTSKTTTPKKK